MLRHSSLQFLLRFSFSRSYNLISRLLYPVLHVQKPSILVLTFGLIIHSISQDRTSPSHYSRNWTLSLPYFITGLLRSVILLWPDSYVLFPFMARLLCSISHDRTLMFRFTWPDSYVLFHMARLLRSVFLYVLLL